MRSITWHSNCCSRLRSCEGDNSEEKITNSKFVSLTSATISSTLPEPIKYLAFTLLRETLRFCTTFSPEDFANSPNSSAPFWMCRLVGRSI
ncbi:hypothetical protein BTURTLESOX_1932 [bacterium endosymbiont of Bathymodiolus sp. 5 South]|nr:hypothetical protein BTURTLESOX_1932 [bacterium endosymbiont of Bathymodiolus sp. 5 South]